jgi:hypothetical protein
MQPNTLTRRNTHKGKIYEYLKKIHIRSETNWKVGSRSGYGSENNHSGSKTLHIRHGVVLVRYGTKRMENSEILENSAIQQ